MSLYIVLAAINVVFWITGAIFHVGPTVHLFPFVSVGLVAADLLERRRRGDTSEDEASKEVSIPVSSARPEPVGHNPLMMQPLLAFGSTMRKQVFVPGTSLEQQSTHSMRRSKFQQTATRHIRTKRLETSPNSTAQLAI